MSNTLYVEGSSGISGDMLTAALLDLGGNQEKLAQALNSLPLAGEFTYSITQAQSHGIAGCSFNVHCHENYEHHHDHAAHHSHGGHHHHFHRNLHDILHIIGHAELTPAARMLAEKSFRIVAEAESKAHNCSIDDVHFHEVGAVDSIVDIVSAAVLVDDLDIRQCIVESLCEGSGTVHCQHGTLPVPVPAVLNIAQAHSIALKKLPVNGEMVTPTGIALAAALRTTDKLPEQYKVKRIGTGVGKREFPHANILRVMLVEDDTPCKQDAVWVLESNIDDASGEILAHAMEKLLSAGALDVHYTPCFMKKNRPAYLLRVITTAERIGNMEEIIFRESTSIGIRRYPVSRSCMSREFVDIKTPYGTVRAKKCSWHDVVKIYPEYESAKAAATAAGVDLATVFNAVTFLSQNSK